MAVADTVLERKRGVDSFHPCEICTPTDISLRGKEKEERESSTRGKFSLRVGNGWKCSKRNYPELVPAVNNRANTTALLLSIFEWRLQSAGTKIFPDTGSIRAHMHGISDELNTLFRRFRVNAAVVPPLHPFRAQLSETFDFPSNGGSGLNRVFVSETLIEKEGRSSTISKALLRGRIGNEVWSKQDLEISFPFRVEAITVNETKSKVCSKLYTYNTRCPSPRVYRAAPPSIFVSIAKSDLTLTHFTRQV